MTGQIRGATAGGSGVKTPDLGGLLTGDRREGGGPPGLWRRLRPREGLQEVKKGQGEAGGLWS